MMLGMTPNRFVSNDHPLQQSKLLVGSVRTRMSPVLDQIYAGQEDGARSWPSICSRRVS